MSVVETYRKPIQNLLTNALRKELAQQGHIASGELLQSIRIVVKEVVNGIEIEGRFLKYGVYVDRGRKAGTKKVPIDAILRWIRVKGIDLRGKREVSVAFAIQHSIFKNGIPSNRNKNKLRWMRGTLEKKTPEVLGILRQRSFVLLDTMVTEMVERSNKRLQVA